MALARVVAMSKASSPFPLPLPSKSMAEAPPFPTLSFTSKLDALPIQAPLNDFSWNPYSFPSSCGLEIALLLYSADLGRLGPGFGVGAGFGFGLIGSRLDTGVLHMNSIKKMVFCSLQLVKGCTKLMMEKPPI